MEFDQFSPIPLTHEQAELETLEDMRELFSQFDAAGLPGMFKDLEARSSGEV